jgi:hypothetical protein
VAKRVRAVVRVSRRYDDEEPLRRLHRGAARATVRRMNGASNARPRRAEPASAHAVGVPARARTARRRGPGSTRARSGAARSSGSLATARGRGLHRIRPANPVVTVGRGESNAGDHGSCGSGWLLDAVCWPSSFRAGSTATAPHLGRPSAFRVTQPSGSSRPSRPRNATTRKSVGCVGGTFASIPGPDQDTLSRN